MVFKESTKAINISLERNDSFSKWSCITYNYLKEIIFELWNIFGTDGKINDMQLFFYDAAYWDKGKHHTTET